MGENVCVCVCVSTFSKFFLPLVTLGYGEDEALVLRPGHGMKRKKHSVQIVKLITLELFIRKYSTSYIMVFCVFFVYKSVS